MNNTLRPAIDYRTLKLICKHFAPKKKDAHRTHDLAGVHIEFHNDRVNCVAANGRKLITWPVRCEEADRRAVPPVFIPSEALQENSKGYLTFLDDGAKVCTPNGAEYALSNNDYPDWERVARGIKDAAASGETQELDIEYLNDFALFAKAMKATGRLEVEHKAGGPSAFIVRFGRLQQRTAYGVIMALRRES